MKSINEVKVIVDTEINKINPYTDPRMSRIYGNGFIYGFLLKALAEDPFLLRDFKSQVAQTEYKRSL